MSGTTYRTPAEAARTALWRKRAWIAAGMFSLAFGWACADEGVVTLPQEQAKFVPPPAYSANGVVATVIDGNVSCAQLNARTEPVFAGITSDWGYKIEGQGAGAYTGTFTLTGQGLTGGAPSDATNSVTIYSPDGVYLNWSATLGIDAVIMKGGQDSYSYVYTPEEFFSDEGLVSPPTNSGSTPAISHVEFCYDYELTASKTAEAVYTRTYEWAIEKLVDPDAHAGFLGGAPFASMYTVNVTQSVTDAGFAVQGEITVNNPTPYTVTFDINDVVAGQNAVVTCASTTLAAGASATCSYVAALENLVEPGTNVAAVSSLDPNVAGAEASAPYAFGDPTTVVGFPSVNITDTNGMSWGASATASFTYPGTFQCPADPAAYVDGAYSETFLNTATIDETGQSDDASVQMDCYNISVAKTAATEWTRQFDWTINKSVDVASHSGRPGDSFTSNYTVDVDQTISEYGYKATGQISVTNPAPMAIDVSVADAVGAIAATVSCGGGGSILNVPGGTTASCSYAVDLPDAAPRVNTATVSFMGRDLTATADILFSPEPTYNVGFNPVHVEDAFDGAPATELGILSGDQSFAYAHTFVCPSDAESYASGVYNKTFPNTARITETDQSDSESVSLSCTPFDLAAEKTAAGSFDEKFTWSITKSVNPGSQSAYAGESVGWDWTVEVSESSAPENFKVTGDITITNANPFAVDFGVSDQLDDLTSASVGCSSFTVPGNGSVTCSYEAFPAGAAATLNTATVSSATPGIGGAIALAPVSFTSTQTNNTATVNDPAGLNVSLTAGLGDRLFNYSGGATCSSDAADYASGGTYTETVDNTATITSGNGESSSASSSTQYTCLTKPLSVSKDAFGEYDQKVTWDISKSVDPLSQSGFAGDVLPWNWTVTVTEGSIEENFRVNGTITVSNPNPFPVPFTAADQLSDGSAASVSCPASVGGNSSASCTYASSATGRIGISNTVNVIPGYDWLGGASATVPVSSWTGSATNTTATVTDPAGLNQTLTSGAGSWSFTYPGQHVCSVNPLDYNAGNGSYSGSETNVATLTDRDGGQDASSTTAYTCNTEPLSVSKTALGEYDQKVTWDISKSVSPLDQSGFAGDALGWDWTVTVTEGSIEENYRVNGTITINNPNAFPVPFDAEDVLSDGSIAAVSCPASVPADGSASCTYSSGATGRVGISNTATITPLYGWLGVGSATVPVSDWTGSATNTTATVTDPAGLNEILTAGAGSWTFTYPGGEVCSTNADDYSNGGSYSRSVTNTATVTDRDSDKSATSTTQYSCNTEPLSVSKTALGEYDQKVTWDISKSVSPLDQSGFAGDALGWDWTVTVTEGSIEENYRVNGTITVTNPNAFPVPFDAEDVLSDGSIAAVSCPAEVPADGSAECTYSSSATGRDGISNTATITPLYGWLGAGSATVPVSDWTGSATNTTATVTDPAGLNETLTSGAGSWTFTYPGGDVCSTNADDYAAGLGSYSQSVTNTATVTDRDSDQDATSTTQYTCNTEPLTVDKTAAGTYDERHIWDVTKSVDPASQSGQPGDVLSWNWTVGVSETFVEENFAVTGTITVNNPNAFPVPFSAADQLSDGSVASVTCPAEVPADGSAECTYSSSATGRTGISNTATITPMYGWLGLGSATVPVSFASNVINGTANLTDDQGPLSESLMAGTGPWSFSYSGSHTCSLNGADYSGENNTYGATLDNVANLIASDGQSAQAQASTQYLCQAAYVDIHKTTNGFVDPSRNWTFSLFDGPDGFGGSQLGSTSSTNGDADGILDFGMPALRTDATYTVCENQVAAGWTSTWAYNGVLFPAYNPDGDEVPPQDLGNRCADFGFGTDYLLGLGQTLTFAVDNAYPGGEPRTPGYWKNWNLCTGGGQAANAERNGGAAEGFWLMDDVLNGPGVMLGDFQVLDCPTGVSILDQRDLSNDRKMASDAAYTLAMHLMAAKLNFAAGAASCTVAQDAVVAGDEMLKSIGYNGEGRYLRPNNQQYAPALAIAKTLDEYNNGRVCTN